MENKNFNLKCEQFKRLLENTINNSGLPIAIVYYIWKYLDKNIQYQYYGYLNQATIKQEKEIKEIKKESEDNI